MIYFISGGCKNGKSYYAQQLAKKHNAGKMYYVATMIPHDEEDLARIRRHISERDGWGFETIEEPLKLSNITENLDGSYLVDSLTALVQNNMFREDGSFVEDAGHLVFRELEAFIKKLRDNGGNAVFVSDYIYSDAIFYDEMVEQYKKELAYVDRKLAELADQVYEVCYSNIKEWK
ncbi:MAG: bifunctional adenosylcobinamide kinase/adenosylcobinamide-phosphate guanylyltransferase [Clostridia bacterium]|nr:bifunctional adenosylcobinamide kinase/adenosylcobinamide-phosphate guanylyltransferase [Clostridia bacterium]